MEWVLFSIIAAFIWALCNVIDKFVLTKWVRYPIVPVIILGIVGLVGGLIPAIAFGLAELSLLNVVLGLLSGMIFILGIILYFQAANLEEISRVIPLFYVKSIFILTIAHFTLGEVFEPIKYPGIFLLVTGAILISLKRPFRISFGKAFWFMMLLGFLLSIEYVIVKYLLGFADYWTVFSYGRFGSFIAALPILAISYRKLVSTVKEYGFKPVFAMSANEGLNLFGILSITIASSIGFISLVGAVASIQPFFVLLLMVILSLFFPRILREEIGKSSLILKIVAILFIFLGTYLVI